MALDDSTLAEPSPLDTDEIPVVVVPSARRPLWSRTWALGGVAVALAAFEALSGLGLLFHYRPLVPSAYFDLADLVEASRFGFVRGLHRWGSHALLITVALHLFRVVVTGAYRPPRRFNYQIGVVLGLVVLFAALTGYLLPWDQHAQWLIRFIWDGDLSGDDALTMVYAFHCGVLPVAGAVLVAYHLRRARRDSLRLLSPSPDGAEAEREPGGDQKPAE